ncbi:uncharacterized protein LOC129299863 [Prosopis cineraria]|uniref:uncharacterized protein LOC129299863 n=1 Tax=Prosopis cineraria TaxID=364024 RepID=UPI00240ED93D|nr:uncharacterized protein LOC129299863 [Prosopis cineraria]
MEEAVELCTGYLSNVDAIGLPKYTKDTTGEQGGIIGKKLISIDKTQWEQVHLYMATPPENSGDAPPTEEEAFKEVKRGKTVMKAVIRARAAGRKLPVNWNDRGQLVKSPQLASYIGVLARHYVPCCIADWRKKNDPQLEEAKNNIWEDLCISFDLDESHRHYIMRKAAYAHRKFRATLTTYHLKDANEEFNPHPPKMYPEIQQEHWDEFIKMRQQPEFQQISQVNRSRAASTPFQYRAGRKSYPDIEHSLREEVGPNAPISRALVWKTAREDKEGKLPDERTRKVWEDCEALSQSISQDDVGEHVDVLGRALGAPEVSGRVRGVGFGISQGTYFGRRSKIFTEDDFNARMAEMEARMEKKFQAQMEKRFEQMIGVINMPQGSPSDKDSCSFHTKEDFPKGESQCQLWLESPHCRVVAIGSVYNDNSVTIHSRPLPADHLKVLISYFCGAGLIDNKIFIY